MRKMLCTITAMLMLLSVGCSPQKESYLDISGDETQTQALNGTTEYASQETEAVTTKYQITDTYDNRKAFQFQNKNCTSDGEALYFEQNRCDLNNNTNLSFCSVPGCEHNDSSVCEALQPRYSQRYWHGYIFFTKGSGVYRRSTNGEVELVYENKFTTEFSEKNYPVKEYDPLKGMLDNTTSPSMLDSLLFIDENRLLVFASNFVFILDITTGKASKFTEVGNSIFNSACIGEGVAFISNMDGELWRFDMNDQSVKRMLQDGKFPTIIGDKIYYTKWNDGSLLLCRNNLEFTDEKTILENIQLQYEVSADGIFYTKREDRKSIFFFSFDDEKTSRFITIKDFSATFGEPIVFTEIMPAFYDSVTDTLLVYLSAENFNMDIYNFPLLGVTDMNGNTTIFNDEAEDDA